MVMRTFGSIELCPGGKHWVITRAEPHVSIRMKQVFPKIAKTAVPPFRLSRSDMLDADLEWFTSRYPFDVKVDDIDAMQKGVARYRQQQMRLEEILRADYVPPAVLGLRDGQEIRPYQVQAIELLRSTGRL